jgi:hypothetical protein
MSLVGHDESLVPSCFKQKRQQNAIEGLPNSATATWINALPSRPRLAVGCGGVYLVPRIELVARRGTSLAKEIL